MDEVKALGRRPFCLFRTHKFMDNCNCCNRKYNSPCR